MTQTLTPSRPRAAKLYILGSVFFCQLAISVTYREFFFEGNPIPYPSTEGEQQALVKAQPGKEEQPE